MDLCLKEQENISKPMSLWTYVQEEHIQSYVIMYLCQNKQKNITKPMSLWTYVKRPCTYKFVNCFQISMASRPPAKNKRLNDVPNRNGIL